MEKLSEDQKKLLEIGAIDLIKNLSEQPSLCHVRQMAFDHYRSETGEQFQIQITVTRDETDFLEFLQIEEMSN